MRERDVVDPFVDPLAEQWWQLAALQDEPLEGTAPDDETVGRDAAAAWVVAPWESAAAIEQTVPGADLAAVLELVDPAAAGDLMLVEAVAAWEKLAAWAHLGAALAAAELSRRASMNPHWHAPVPTRTCVAGDELAMRLAWSRPAAHRLVRDGRALANELLLVTDAVRAGLLDTPKLRTLTDRLHDRPGELAWAVQEAVLPEASTRTPSQLAADIDRALLAVDPVDAADRLPRAIAQRHVCHPKPLPDAMAGIWAVLPAVDAVRIDTTLEATARSARALGDPRTLDQIRADVFVALATGDALLAGTTPSDTTSAGGAPAATSARSDQWIGDRATTVSPVDTPRHELPDGEDPYDRVGDDPARAGRLGDDVRDQIGAASTDSRHPAIVDGRRIRIPQVRIDVTVALSTLMGLDEHPADLTGFGPLSAAQARALAAGGTWRRLVTDPLTGAVLDVGRTRYRPPQPLATHILARDRTCAGPGCSVPAHHCHLDHTTEYHGPPANGSLTRGTTSADNLGPLSDRCHRLKTDGGYTLTQISPGIFEWHTPTGLAYRVTPGHHGHTQRLPTRADTNPSHGYPDTPPF